MKLTDLIEKILSIISQLPDPASLTKMIRRIEGSNNTLGFDEAKNILFIDFLQALPAKKGTVVFHVKVMSSFSCPECGTDINNGYFKVLQLSLSKSVSTETVEVNQQIVMSYEVHHKMEKHRIYNKNKGATNESFGELQLQNDQKNPRNQLSQQELQEQIKNYSLEELYRILSEMM